MAPTVEFHCEHCDSLCRAAKSMVGGIINCKECGQATEVPGMNDPAWRMLNMGAVIFVAGITTLIYMRAGPTPALIVGVVLFALLKLLSLAL